MWDAGPGGAALRVTNTISVIAVNAAITTKPSMNQLMMQLWRPPKA
jgi:hypothetical protein